jgi:hexosaminidase
MRRFVCGLLLITWFIPGFSQTTETLPSLMPMPGNLARGGGQFRLDKNLRVAVQGNPGERLTPAIDRFLSRLAGRTGLFLTHPVFSGTASGGSAALVIRCEKVGKTALGEDESYTLTVNTDRITLSAPTDLGALHGMETLLQLLQGDAKGYFFPSVSISDSPRFAWRGLLIDVGRHFQPMEVMKRNLDGMAMLKMNVLHWHLSDDQGFRVESKTYPKLHQLGSDGQYYTQEQVRELVRYADQRGIRVVPELDMPGHVTSWLVGYPELASGLPPNKDSIYRIERKWGIFKPSLDPSKETTYQFIDNLLKEMTALFPDAYIHLGGDENEGSQWRDNPKIQAFMKANQLADNHALQSYFHQRVLPMLTKRGKKAMAWEEVLAPGLSKELVMQSWRHKQSMIDAARQGHPVVLSHGFYIDLNYSAAKHYLNDPVPVNTQMDAEAQKRVLGGEAAIWTEYTDETVIDSRIWPRTAAIAERLWSPREVNNVDDMYRRLEVVSIQLEEVGLTHLKNAEMLLRRMVQGRETAPLRTLVEVLEPVKEYERGSMADYTAYSPLSRVVDAANPDSRQAREFGKLVDAFLETKISQSVKSTFSKKKGSAEAGAGLPENAEAAIENQLRQWQENHEKLKPMITASPVLQEIATLSEDLSAMAGAGLEALNYIRSGKAVPANWLDPQRIRFDSAKVPRAQVMLVVVEPMLKLVNWASVKR